MLLPPLRIEEARKVKIVKGPNIASLPDLTPPPDVLELPIMLKLGDNISTDTISPAGARALPFRSNIAQIAKFSYDIVDRTYYDRAMAVRAQGGHAIVGGRNYGQGSSREHAGAGPAISWLTTGHRQGRGTDSLAKPREFRRSTSHLHGCGRLRSPWAR